MKRLISLLLAVMLVLSLAIPAFATEGGEGGGGEGGGTENPPPCSHAYDNACDTTCNLCPATRTVTHTYDNGCDTTFNVCGGTRDPSHTYDNACDTSCNGCGATRTTTHAYDNACDTTCNVCGATRTTTHTWNEGAVTKQPSCQNGIMTYTCAVCRTTRDEPITATGNHVFGSATKVDDSVHTASCIGGCGTVRSDPHGWNGGNVTTPATCVSTGVMTFSCNGCSATKTSTIPVSTTHSWGAWTTTDTAHTRNCQHCIQSETGNHTFAYTVTKEATCAAEGTKVAKCTVCGKEKAPEAIPLAKHTYDNDCDEECNVCKAKRAVEHKYYNYYTISQSSHWYTCSLCKAKKDVQNHVPGPLPTEEKPQICLTCGYEIMPKLKHTHKFDKDKWESDDSGHWHRCTTCEMEVDFTKHKFEGDCGDGCTECGYVNDKGHIYDGSYQSDKASHWALCKVCGTASEAEAHTPGPAATAGHPQVCTVCNYEIAVYVEHEHIPGEWITNEAEHWKVCAECEERLNQGIHSWDEGVEGKDNTLIRTCIDCGETKTEIQTAKKTVAPWWILLVVLVVCFIGTLALLIKLIISTRNEGRFS